MSNITQRGSGLHTVSFDIRNPQHAAAAVVRLANFGLSGSPSDRRAGRNWYPEAHDIVQESRGGLSMRAASGITSALSPGSDWSARNVPALSEAVGLRPREWSDIQQSHASAVSELQQRRAAGVAGRWDKPSRHPDIDAMLRERAPHLVGSSNPQLLKAHRMIQGEDPDVVLPRMTSPKTNAFYHGILNPQHGGSQVPIDYRMADIAANSMRSYSTPRYIDKDRPPGGSRGSGGPSNYALHENLVGAVGTVLTQRGGRAFAFGRHPLHTQAYLWHMSKQMELSHPQAKRTSTGAPFTGPHRTGQAYTAASGEPAW